MGTTAAIIKITVPYDAIAIAIAYYLDWNRLQNRKQRLIHTYRVTIFSLRYQVL